MAAHADLNGEAIAVIEEQMTEVLRRRLGGTLVVVEIDPDGDGVLLVRTARLEQKDQLTSQITQLLSAAQTASRRPRLIVACAGVSGVRPLNERPDLLAVLEALDQDRCRWVAVCGHERIARSTQTTQRFVAQLRLRDAALYVSDLHRSVLDAAELESMFVGILFAADERARVATRLQLGLKAKRRTCEDSVRSGSTHAKRGATLA
jgi:DNA invertase Pin-like site-specific DNA recombinase